MPPTSTPAPAVTAPAVAAKPKFGEPVADVLAQILPHFDRIRDDCEEQARELSYTFVKGGAKDQAILAEAQSQAHRSELYANAATSLLADSMLPAALATWYHDQQN